VFSGEKELILYVCSNMVVHVLAMKFLSTVAMVDVGQ
jgi:hypothetical protein